MSDRPQTDEPRSILKRIMRLLAFRIALALAIVSAAGWWIMRPGSPRGGQDQSSERRPPTPSRDASPRPVPLTADVGDADSLRASRSRTELRTVYTASENARAIAKVKQGRLVRLADDTKSAIDAAIALSRRFAGELHALLADQRGRRIARREDLVERYRSVSAGKRTSVEELARLGDEVDRLSAPVRRATVDPDDISVPDEKQGEEVARILARADEARNEYERASRELELLVDESTTLAEAPTTLADAIAGVERSELLDAGRIVSDARARASREAAEARAKAEAEAIRIAGEAEARAILDAARREKEEAEARLAQKRAEEQEEMLWRRVHSREVAHYLAAFIAHGFKQPLEFQGAFLAFDGTTVQKPTSFARLKAIGALDDGEQGLARLAWVVSDPKNDRPRLRFSTTPGDWSPETREFLARAQQLLRELGPTLVEAGLLAP